MTQISFKAGVMPIVAIQIIRPGSVAVHVVTSALHGSQ